MAFTFLALGILALLILGYHFYGGYVSRQLELDDSRLTPAHQHQDGVDFIPTSRFYLFAQHFSAIAAAGPIAGPIVACQSFGWLPALLWIALGVVLIGAVHDFTTLAASVRHGAQSIAEVTASQLGKKAGRAMMFFIWIAIVYIIVAFTDITASSFVSASEELSSLQLNFNPGGAVAAASLMYLLLSLLLGLVQKYLRPPLWLVTVIFVPLTFFLAWAGTYLSHVLILDVKLWALLIMLYCALASVLPVWLLLQPRGYLGGFVLYSALLIGLVGLFFGDHSIKQPAFVAFHIGGMSGSLFPFLFVTIACGACSGFHGLICSGTTSKQVDREKHMHAVGYGAMLAEGMVAVLALAIVMMMSPEEVKGMKPGAIYGKGIGQFLTLIIGQDKLQFAMTFGAMAFSTFVFDTLDVSTRLGRYLLQELFSLKGSRGIFLSTLLTVIFPTLILLFTPSGLWPNFWTLFGASNQLLAALSLLTITLWLYQARKRIWYTLLPMLFVLVITLWALVQLSWGNWQLSRGVDVALLNSLLSVTLIVLALYLNLLALKKVRSS